MAGCSADLNMSDVLLLAHDDGDLSEDELFYCKISAPEITGGQRSMTTGNTVLTIQFYFLGGQPDRPVLLVGLFFHLQTFIKNRIYY